MKRIRWLLEHDYNYNEACWGTPGVGKTTAELSTAKHLDPFFTHDQILYNVQDFFTLEKKITRPGTAVVLDEGAVDMNNKRSMTLFAQLLSMISFTNRFKQIIVLTCLPNIQLLTLDQKRLLKGVLWLFDERRGIGEYSRPREVRDGDMYLKPWPSTSDYLLGWDRPFQKYQPPVANFRFEPFPAEDPFWLEYLRIKRESHKDLEYNVEMVEEKLEDLSKAAIKGSMYRKRPRDPEAALEQEMLRVGQGEALPRPTS